MCGAENSTVQFTTGRAPALDSQFGLLLVEPLMVGDKKRMDDWIVFRVGARLETSETEIGLAIEPNCWCL